MSWFSSTDAFTSARGAKETRWTKGSSSAPWAHKPGYPNRSKGKGKTRYYRPPQAFHATGDGWYDQEGHYPEELSPYGYYASGYAPECGWDDTARADPAWLEDGQAEDQTWGDEESYALWSPVQGGE